MVEGIDPDLVIPDRTMSVYEGAVVCWRGQVMNEWKDYFVRQASKAGFPVHRAIDDLSEEEFDILWNGRPGQNIEGVKQFFEYVEKNIYKIQYCPLIVSSMLALSPLTFASKGCS